jgi:WD40 repeat protein
MSAAQAAPAPDASLANPYVGPRTFTYAQRRFFFGRAREARDLAARIVSERLLLFYAQSGAGKSSLLNTRVIPHLREEEGFAVLPVARVAGELPAGVTAVDNIYLFNLIASIDQHAPAELAHLGLADFLARLTSADGEAWHYDPAAIPAAASGGQRYILIIDQFEEIVTAHPEHWPERSEFFRQLNQVLRADPDLWVLLTLREDYVASLDSYAPLLDGRLQARFFMERMGVTGARAAVQEPARLAGRPFAPGVAEQIVDDLRRVQTGVTGGEDAAVRTALGDYVEPVQLQIVCFGLWNRLPPGHEPIRLEEYRAFGNIDQALTHFYEDALVKTSQGASVSERQLRAWFDTQLITPAGTRGLVYRGADTTAGLPNAAVDQLAAIYLIRAEVRGGNRYYELSHDRLLEPVQTANRRWLATYANPLVTPARHWLAAGRDPAHLLDGMQLEQARTYAVAHPNELLVEERELLAESEREQAVRQAAAAARSRRRRITAIAGAVIGLMLLALTIWALRSAQEAATQRSEALRQAAIAEANRAEAEQQRVAAEAQTQLARSRELAAAANANLYVDPELSILLAQEAHAITYTLEAESALRQALQTSRVVARYPISDPGQAVAYSPDGQRMAVASTATIQMWELAATPGAVAAAPIFTITLPEVEPTERTSLDTGGVRDESEPRVTAPGITSGEGGAPVAPGTGALLDMVISPDGALLATAHSDGMTYLWDAATGDLVRTLGQRSQAAGLPAPQPGVIAPAATGAARNTAVAFSPNGAQLAAAYLDGTVKIWDVATGAEVIKPIRVNRRGVLDVAYSPDGARLATATIDNRVDLWDPATGAALNRPPAEHIDAVYAVAFSPDGAYLASGSKDKSVIVWDARGPELDVAYVNRSPTNTVTDVAFSADGGCLAYASLDRTVHLHTTEPSQAMTGAIVLQGHGEGVRRLAFRPLTATGSAEGGTVICGEELATVAYDGTARRWNIGPTAEELTIAGHALPVEDVVHTPDGAKIAAVSDDGAVKLWDGATGDLVREFAGHPTRANAVDVSPDGRRLASAGFDGVVRIWDIASGAEVAAFIDHTSRVQDVSFSRDGRFLASGSNDQFAILYDAATLTALAFYEHGAPVYGVTFSPDGRQLVTTGSDGLIKFWPAGVATETATMTLTHSSVVQTAAFSPDGRQLASISWDGSVRLWNAASGALLDTLRGHTDRIYGVAYSPDGTLLATSSADGTVRLWDPVTGQVRHVLYGPEFNVLDFRPDGRALAVGGEDGTVRVYVIDSGDLLDLAQARVTRSLTTDECLRYLQTDVCP